MMFCDKEIKTMFWKYKIVTIEEKFKYDVKS